MIYPHEKNMDFSMYYSDFNVFLDFYTNLFSDYFNIYFINLQNAHALSSIRFLDGLFEFFLMQFLGAHQ